MKKLLFAALAGTMVLASCSNNEVDQSFVPTNPQEINLNAFLSRTRVGDKSVFAGGESFHVNAKENGGTEWYVNQAYTFTDPDWTWAPGATPKWPNDVAKYPMNFYATYPNQTLTSFADPSFNYTIPATQVDLLACAATAATKPANGVLPFAFKHALSKIDFKVKAGNGVKVYLQSIKVVNVKNDGKLTFNGGDFSWDNGADPQDQAYTYVSYLGAATKLIDASAAEVTEAAGAAADAMMLMPQTSTPWDKAAWKLAPTTPLTNTYLEVVYRMTDKDGNDLVGKTSFGSPAGERFVKVAFPVAAANFTWAKSTNVTYTIFLGTADSSNGTIIDDKFVDDNGGDSGDNNTDGNKGKDVTEGEKDMSLSVSISAWGTDAADVK